MLIILIILGIAALIYLFEVVLGSSSAVYNCELGEASTLSDKTPVSKREFFGKILPLLLAVLGGPLLFTRLPLGFGAPMPSLDPGRRQCHAASSFPLLISNHNSS